MASQARVLYDFEGNTLNGELIIREGDTVTITRKDVGEGWWEGYIRHGQKGLFPESYVQEITDFPSQAFPPPPEISIMRDESRSSYGSSTMIQHERNDGQLDPRDEWDDCSSTSDNVSGDYHFGSPGQRLNSMSRAGTVKKSMNRFSNFVKSGGEGFLLASKVEQPLPETEQIVVVDGPDGAMWQQIPVPFTCQVTEPEKKTKYKGMKSYIAYSVTPSHTGKAVQHRFKHFVWLSERLVEKFTCISVPPLPDKQLTGRYSDDLIKKRRYLLEKWLNRISRHPVLAQSFVFQHFINCCSETREKEWKDGKRKAETDKAVATQFFYTLVTPPVNMSQQKVEHEVDQFKDFVRAMDESAKNLITIGESQWDKVSRSYKQEYKKLASGFENFASSFATDTAPYSLALTQAVEHTGHTYSEIGDLCQEQPKNDVLNLLEVLREYTGILSTYPDIIDVHKGAMAKVKECQKLQTEEKIKYAEVADIESRMGKVTNGMFAEINHFQRERCKDFKLVMQHFLNEQIRFHQEIISKLRSSLTMYDHVPD